MSSSHDIVKCFEFEDVDLRQDEIRLFLSKGYITQRQSGHAFCASGVFTSPSRIFVCLPWATKHIESLGQVSSSDVCGDLLFALGALREIVTEIDDRSVDAMSLHNGREFVLAAMSLRLRRLVTDAVRYNVFRSEVTQSSVIKGRWLLHNDIAKTPSPTTFTCEVSECDRNHPILLLAAAFCYRIQKVVSSRYLKNVCKSMHAALGQMADSTPLDESLVEEAYRLCLSDRRFKDWRPWIAALKTGTIPIEKRNHVSASGDDVVFPTAVFFERVVESALIHLGCSVESQVSSEILGGGYWIEDLNVQRLDETPASTTKSRLGSRPDLLAKFDGSKIILVECKYKPLQIVRKPGKPSQVSGLSPADRNQILSFVLSQSERLRFDARNIVMVFPVIANQSPEAGTPTLGFMATIEHGNSESQVAWQSGSTNLHGGHSGIRIHFVGIDVPAVIQEIKNGNFESNALSALKTILARGATQTVEATDRQTA